MKKLSFAIFMFLIFASFAHAQIPVATLIKIVKAEDARAYDKSLEVLLKSPNAAVRSRATLAAGRIGNDAAITTLSDLLEKDSSEPVRIMAAFAIGEIESIKGADAILKASNAETRASTSVPGVESRLVEAAGKIAAANPKDEKSKALGSLILKVLRKEPIDRETARHALTAALRARPEGADVAVAKFLTNPDARLRSDAANTLTRLRAKNANETLRKMLVSDSDATARANAARAIGAAEDKDALDLLISAATTDKDSRVRVSAIRSLGSLKDPKAADKLIDYGQKLFIAFKFSKYAKPKEQNELLEIATALGRILATSRNEKAMQFLGALIEADYLQSPEISIAKFNIAPGKFNESVNSTSPNWRQIGTLAQLLTELAAVEDKSVEAKKMKADGPEMIRETLNGIDRDSRQADKKLILAMPDAVRAFAAFKTDDLASVLRTYIGHQDTFVRATAAELIAGQPASKENIEALKTSFAKALLMDKHDNDAQLAILDALFKLDKKASVGTLLTALNATDYLVRKKAFELLADTDLQRDPQTILTISNARKAHKDQVLPYNPKSGTKLGQVLNSDPVYRRALSRKNGNVKAVLTTEKGTFTIVFNPEEAPLTVDNFVKLARKGYFNGLEVHRVVPNFVMQDGDPRGDGNGGPGWSIRCEVNQLQYDRGAVGMALSGKDTGGSQWFVTHSPQPHLDGGYTVFGHVDESGMKIVDNIVRGDRILKVTIIEGTLQRKGVKAQRRK